MKITKTYGKASSKPQNFSVTEKSLKSKKVAYLGLEVIFVVILGKVT